MNREQIMEAMNYIDPALIEAADRKGSTAKGSRIRWSRPAVIAACLCLVLAGTALAWNSSTLQINWVGSDAEEWMEDLDVVYTIDWDLAYFPLDRISDKITGLAAEIQNDTAAWPFNSWDELEEYLGMDLFDNSVLDAAAPGPQHSYEGMSGRATHILLMARFGDKGLVTVSADGSYVIDGIWVRPETQFYTDLMREDVELYAEQHGKPAPGLVTGGDDQEVSMEEIYTTPSGLEVTITRNFYDYGDGWQSTKYLAHFSINGVRCNIVAGTYPVDYSWEHEDPVHTLEILKEVLDGFAYEPAA